MTYLTIGSLIFGILGFAFGIRFYIELWRWARQCQRAQIVIAYKRKVKLSAPLVEWLLWTNQLKKEDANGRVLYSMGSTSVAVVKGKTSPRKTLRALALGRVRKRRTRTPTPVRREGTWSARDNTKVGAK